MGRGQPPSSPLSILSKGPSDSFALLNPAAPGELVSTFLPVSLKPKWKLPLEDSKAPAALGQRRRFKINTLLTDRFFIYTFSQEL